MESAPQKRLHRIESGPFTGQDSVSLHPRPTRAAELCPQGWWTYPVTIVQARYSGAYERAAWLAFPCDSHRLDVLCDGWQGSDIECMQFWKTARNGNWAIGYGETPDTALGDLMRRLTSAAGIESPAS